MKINNFIVLVLDSFGIGEMADVSKVRPQDKGSNTVLHLMENKEAKYWNNLEKLGLFNALGNDKYKNKYSKTATYGKSELKHFGADTFFGHQEIIGTRPKEPIKMKFSEVIDEVENDLEKNNFKVTRYKKNNLELLVVNKSIFIGDNMETDLGQAINVVGALDICGFDNIKKVGNIVRKHVKVPRVIAFGGSDVDYSDLEANVITKDDYIGVDAPNSGVYKKNYHCVHIGYGVEPTVQLPYILNKIDIKTYLYGKVADICYNPNDLFYPNVDTDLVFMDLIHNLKSNKKGFHFVNIQETDLSGHDQNPKKYINIVNKSDVYIGGLIKLLGKDDLLIVMADHGNDPTNGSSKHSRENVPILIYNSKISNIQKPNYIGLRKTMADVGATGAEFYGTKLENGTSFLKELKL